MPIAIGVDIGGTHISSAAVSISENSIISETYFHGPVDSKGSKEQIFSQWAEVINASLASLNGQPLLGVGLAMPGPFRYREGIALFKRNDKYESLCGISVMKELPTYLDDKTVLRFINDATSFGLGGSLMFHRSEIQRVVAVTLGTGFGAAFLKDHIPITDHTDVPKDGCLWNKTFQKGIADDYFSTRWFLSQYEQATGHNGIVGVKELIALKDFDPTPIFEDFGENISHFMLPYLKDFNADLLVLGGSIAKAHDLFLPAIMENWKKLQYEIPVEIVENTEEAGIIGASNLFKEHFWEEVKNELPEI